jgi:hypothetical protein
MLRHACGFKMANDGVDTRTIQAYLGHKDIRHTVRYTELSPVRFKGLWKDSRPSPRPAPVTTATFPSNEIRPVISLSSSRRFVEPPYVQRRRALLPITSSRDTSTQSYDQSYDHAFAPTSQRKAAFTGGTRTKLPLLPARPAESVGRSRSSLLGKAQ